MCDDLRMEPEIALRIAAAENDLTTKQAQALISSFITELKRCPLCNGAGSLDCDEWAVNSILREYMEAGRMRNSSTVSDQMNCPACFDFSNLEGSAQTGIHQRNAVWQCSHIDVRDSGSCKPGGEGHASCGYRIIIHDVPTLDSGDAR